MKKYPFILFTTLLLVVFSNLSCNLIGQLDDSNNSKDVITIGINDVCRNDQYNFTLQIDSVLSDSRCAYGAECIWAGNAEVRMKLIVNNFYKHLFNLNTLQSFRQDTVIRGINITLIDLFPHPDIHVKYSYQSYHVKIKYSIVNNSYLDK